MALGNKTLIQEQRKDPAYPEVGRPGMCMYLKHNVGAGSVHLSQAQLGARECAFISSTHGVFES